MSVCLSINVVCCQVAVSAKGRSLAHRSPTECVCVCVCVSVCLSVTECQWVGRRGKKKKEIHDCACDFVLLVTLPCRAASGRTHCSLPGRPNQGCWGKDHRPEVTYRDNSVRAFTVTSLLG
jgi:hypothetical protein